jgi:tetratricopeptide (TPR) repeat protein
VDAFISHASAHKALALELLAALETDGLSGWVDQENLRAGSLLRSGLHHALEASRVLVLLWSEAAKASRWVAAELLTAFHLGHYTVPCVLDDTPLPSYLRKARHLDLRPQCSTPLSRVAHEVANAPDGANPLMPVIRAREPEVVTLTSEIHQLQDQELAHLLRRKLPEARQVHAQIEARIRRLEEQWPLEMDVLKYGGFHRKNGYMIAHWAEIQAGQPSPDPLLEEAERKFFDTLFVKPTEESALDGLASVLLLEGEPDAAAFFDVRAIHQAAVLGINYSAARFNLNTIMRFKPALRVPPEYVIDPSQVDTSQDAQADCERGRQRWQQAQHYREALEAYERALVRQPKLAEAHLYRGAALLYLDRADEGLEAIHRACKLSPDAPQVHSVLGAALVGLGRYQEGLKALDLALDLAPGDPEPIYNKACAYSMMHEGEQALKCLKQAILAHPAYRDTARDDPHFENLRKSLDWASRFRDLVE